MNNSNYTHIGTFFFNRNETNFLNLFALHFYAIQAQHVILSDTSQSHTYSHAHKCMNHIHICLS